MLNSQHQSPTIVLQSRLRQERAHCYVFLPLAAGWARTEQLANGTAVHAGSIQQGYQSGVLQPGGALTFAPQWVSLSIGTLKPDGLRQAVPTGELRQPFTLFEFCVPAATASGRKVHVQTLSRARGHSDTLLYVARVAGTNHGHRARIEQGSFARSVPACASMHHLAEPVHANSTACERSGQVQLSELDFHVPSNAEELANAGRGQLCYRAYVMLQHRRRMLADIGLQVQWA